MTAESSTQGAQAESASTGESLAGGGAPSVWGPSCSEAVEGGSLVAARRGFPLASGRHASAVERGAGSASARGFHTRRNRATAAIDESAAIISAA